MALVSDRSLVRGLTVLPAAAIVVTNVIGSGVFVKARVMTCNVGSPWLVLLAYALAGVLTFAGAISLSELSAMMPRAGGHYNFIGAAFGRLWAFLFGWMETFIDAAGSGAALAIAFAIFFNDLVGGTLSDWQSQSLAAGMIVAVTVLNLASVKSNGFVATAIVILKVLLVAGIGVAAFVFSGSDPSNFAASGADGVCEGVSASAKLGATGFGAAMIGALWSYNGWATVTFVAEEVRDPGRTLPRALLSGSAILIVLYLLANAGYFLALSPMDVASVPESASVAAAVLTRIIGASGASVMAAGMMLSTVGALHANNLGMSRVPFAMARDGLLPSALARVTKRSRIPGNAVVLLGVCGIAFALTGTFDIITDMIVFALLIFNGLAVASVYVLRRKLPDVERPYRAWGYPVVPALFLIASVYLLINTLIATPGRAIAGLAIIAIGIPVYAWYARGKPAKSAEEWL